MPPPFPGNCSHSSSSSSREDEPGQVCTGDHAAEQRREVTDDTFRQARHSGQATTIPSRSSSRDDHQESPKTAVWSVSSEGHQCTSSGRAQEVSGELHGTPCYVSGHQGSPNTWGELLTWKVSPKLMNRDSRKQRQRKEVEDHEI